MNYTIKTKEMTYTVEQLGAQLISAQSNDKFEYIWQRNPAVWSQCAPILFPICGRISDETYRYNGESYHMTTHGFFRSSNPRVIKQTENSLEFILCDNEATRQEYPFNFSVRLTFTAKGKSLTVKSVITNSGNGTMPFMYGGHPGFKLPLEENLSTTDYYLDFKQDGLQIYPMRPAVPFFYNDPLDYPLNNGKLDLTKKKLHDGRTLVFGGSNQVRLASDKGTRAVSVEYGDFDFIGFWQDALEGADYVCIEPWSGIPLGDEIENFETRSYMERLAPGESKTFEYTIHFK